MALGEFPTLCSLPFKTKKQTSLCIPLFRWTCLVASKGNYFELASAIKRDLDEDMGHLLKPCTRIWLSRRRPWEPSWVSSQLALCFSPLLFSVHLMFSSLHWSPQQKPSLLIGPEHSQRECSHRRAHKYSSLSPFPLWTCVVLVLSGACHTTKHGQGQRIMWKVTPSRHHSVIHACIRSVNNR